MEAHSAPYTELLYFCTLMLGRILFGLLACCFAINATAQSATLYGTVRDANGQVIETVHVFDKMRASRYFDFTDAAGRYELEVPSPGTILLTFSYLQVSKDTLVVVGPGANRQEINVRLATTVNVGPAEITGQSNRGSTMQSLDPRVSGRIPSPGGDITALLRVGPGVSITSELSNQYNVRGGNFDENLVYVNDIQVYRPFLVRAGQQEGLSFPNPDMVDRIEFSAGGWEAKYGDRMSSVLDIHYRKPNAFGGAASLGLLGGSLQLEGVSKDGKWTHNTGLRYRSNAYVLGSLDTQGDYNPRYTDLQTYVTWKPEKNAPLEIAFLGNFSRNQYNFIPQTRQTDVGNINEAIRLTVFFDGQEESEFETYFGALSFNYQASEKVLLRFIGSAFQTYEQERFDILGQYFLDELERDLGSDEFGEVLQNLGVGAFLDHGRNELEAQVLNFTHKGFANLDVSGHFLEWGIRFNTEVIDDRLVEWTLIDSAGYATPHVPDNIGFENPGGAPNTGIPFRDVIRGQQTLNNTRATAFIQDSFEWEGKNGGEWAANVGVRAHRWSFNEQLVGGPRATVSYRPAWTYIDTSKPDSTGTRDIVFKLSGGYYWQPPFYREMRTLTGGVNPEIRAQRSLHAVLGADYLFESWGRPFVLNAEVYYKHLTDIIPYEVENVKIRYYATNNARGYATGADLMLNGEFIPGIQSWLRASFLQTAEDIDDDFYYERYNADGDLIVDGFTLDDVAVDSTLILPGFIPRPTDQRFSFSLLFQDEMPKWPEYKVIISLFYGTGLPFGPPGFDRYQDVLRTPAYRRVDIGFSRDLVTDKNRGVKGFGKWAKDGIVSLEIFNLLAINNTINYQWIEDVNGRQYAIPNFLTGRRVNLKLAVRF